jgi:DNA ligase-1
MLLDDLVSTSRAVAGTSARLGKIEQLASLLSRAAPDEIEIVVDYLSGTPRQGRIGVGGARLREARPASAAASSSLTLAEVDATFARIAATAGPGSAGEKARLLSALLARATADEQDFLVRLLAGELRQGAQEGVVLEAVARAGGVPAARVRRAAMAAGDLAGVARALLVEGDAALDRFLVAPFRPVQPMLAESADDVREALARLGEASFEYKLDGARIQAHKAGNEVRVFSRALRDVTAALPEVVEAVRAMPARELILDGEAIALAPGGAPLPFQITMRRFGRRLDVEALRRELPLTPFFFDCLYLDGTALVDAPHAERMAALAAASGGAWTIPRIGGATMDEAEAFAAEALARGHEGVMAKAPGAPYTAGRRGQAWLKIKRTRTLDLVVLAAEWGHGRRRGWLSNLHLGARDEAEGGYVMLGKTFKGLTDEMLAWQTRRLLELEVARDAYTVYVRPELVVEIAFGDLQESPHYPARLALRFARVRRYRPDKTAAEADTIATVREIYWRATGRKAPIVARP